MSKTAALLTSLSLVILPVTGLAQQESNPAEERARIANQRIQAEAQRLAEEQRRAAEAEARQQAAEEAARAREAQSRAAAAETVPVRAEPPAPPPADRPLLPTPEEQARMEKALQQIRSLGELRDAGYVTDDEFEQIKRRILDDRL
ncbi:MAG: SHOCT domain-containing protein [Pseudomonadota bacterium]